MNPTSGLRSQLSHTHTAVSVPARALANSVFAVVAVTIAHHPEEGVGEGDGKHRVITHDWVSEAGGALECACRTHTQRGKSCMRERAQLNPSRRSSGC
jgi:hypothetical protein